MQMKIIIDTREKPQAIKSIKATFERLGVEYEVRKLDTADYMNPEKPEILVDRKQNLSEVISNLGNKKSRFYRECERANAEGKRLIVLVEHGKGIEKLEDVALKWENPNYGNRMLCMSSRELLNRMYKVQVMYGVEWQFCDKKRTGERLVEILRGDK